MEIQWSPQARNKEAIILVEGRTDAIMVEVILERLSYPGRANIKPCYGISHLIKELRYFEEWIAQTRANLGEAPVLMALIDADELSVSDARGHARKRLGNPDVPVFCAVPQIESWLFADPAFVQSEVRTQKDRRTIARVIAPDTLPNPKMIARKIFGPERAANPWFFRKVNLASAIAHSASLADFIDGLVQILGGQSNVKIEAVGSQLSRSVFSNLLREIPANTVGWRTVNGEYSAAELADMVLHGDHVGFQYVTELLRLARDILAARAQDSDV